MHRVAMGKFPVEDIRKYLGIAVLVRREPRPRRDAVFIQHAQGPEGLEARVGVLRKGEGVVAIQPAVIRVASGRGAARGNFGVGEGTGHDSLSFGWGCHPMS